VLWQCLYDGMSSIFNTNNNVDSDSYVQFTRSTFTDISGVSEVFCGRILCINKYSKCLSIPMCLIPCAFIFLYCLLLQNKLSDDGDDD